MTTYGYRYQKVFHFFKIPPGFNIHHIDFCRDHNEIENLVMLPSSLHNNYHRIIPPGFSGFVVPTSLCNFEPDISNILEFYEVQHECWKWLEFRNFLNDCLQNKSWFRKIPAYEQIVKVLDYIDIEKYRSSQMFNFLLERVGG